MGEILDGLGVTVRTTEDEFPVRGAAQGVGADGQTADGDVPDGKSTESVDTEHKSAIGDGADAEASKRDCANRDSTEREDSLCNAPDSDYAAGKIADGDNAVRMAARFALLGIGAEGDTDQRQINVGSGGLPANRFGGLHLQTVYSRRWRAMAFVASVLLKIQCLRKPYIPDSTTGRETSARGEASKYRDQEAI
jgi:hypothetical protein